METATIDVTGLYERGTIVREDMRNHPKMKAHRPHPVGIAGAGLGSAKGEKC